MQHQGVMTSYGGMVGMQQKAMNIGEMMGMLQQQEIDAAPAPVMVTPPANGNDFSDFEDSCPQKQMGMNPNIQISVLKQGICTMQGMCNMRGTMMGGDMMGG
jgi:hypothetical protein